MADLATFYRAEDQALYFKGDSFKQEDLQTVERTWGRGLKILSITLDAEYIEDAEVVDFTTARFPDLISLSLNCCGLNKIVFNQNNTPRLRSLRIEQAKDVAAFDLDLPDLESLSFEFVTLRDTNMLSESIARSPRLASFCAFQLWGLGRGIPPFLNLPRCKYLSLYRSNDLESLDLYAPKLTEVNLQDCFDLKRVRLHSQPMPMQKLADFKTKGTRIFIKPDEDEIDQAMDEMVDQLLGPAASAYEGPSEPKVKFDLVNTRPPVSTVLHLRQHPRVGDSNITVTDQSLGYPEDMDMMYGDPSSSSGSSKDRDADNTARLDAYIEHRNNPIEPPPGPGLWGFPGGPMPPFAAPFPPGAFPGAFAGGFPPGAFPPGAFPPGMMPPF